MSGKFREKGGIFFRTFAVALAAAAAVLGAVVMFWPIGNESAAPEPEQVYIPDAADRLTTLAFGVTDEGGAEVCLLLGFLPDRGRIAVCALPPLTYLKFAGNESNISACLEQGGAKYAAACVSEYLGIPVDRTAVYSAEGFSELVDRGGPVEYEIPPALHQVVGGVTKGKIALDGKKAVTIMLYRGTERGEAGRSDNCAMLMSRLLSYHTAAALTDTGRELWKAAIAAAESTDCTVADYDGIRMAAAFLASRETSPTTVVFVEGDQGSYSYFLSESCRSRITEMYAAP